MDSLAYKSQPGRMYHFIHLMSCQIPTKRFRAVLRMTLGSNRAGKSHDTESKSGEKEMQGSSDIVDANSEELRIAESILSNAMRLASISYQLHTGSP